MRNRLENITEFLVIGILLSIWIVTCPSHSFESNLATIINVIIWIAFYLIQVKWLIPRYFKKTRFRGYLVNTIILLIIAMIILLIIESIHLSEMYYRRYYVFSSSIDYLTNFKYFNFQEIIASTIVVYIGVILYGILRHWNYPNNTLFRNIMPISFSGIVLLLSIATLILVIKENIKTKPILTDLVENKNEEITFITQTGDVNSLIDIITQINNVNSPICVTFWTPSCGSQYSKIEQINKIRTEIGRSDIEYLYVCGEYDNSLNHWKDFIVNNNIIGHHIYLERPKFHEIFIKELGIKTGVVHVILLNSNHEFVSKDLRLLDNGQNFVEELKGL